MKRNHRGAGRIVGSLAALTALLITTQATAGIGAGGRAGFSSNPDQVVIGGQAAIGSVAPMIQLVPSVDVGFGDDISITAINIDFQYNLPSLPKVSPNLYVGAGPTIVMSNPDGGSSDSEFGISLVAGLRIPMTGVSYYNLEARFGLNNVPDLKILFGIMFGL